MALFGKLFGKQGTPKTPKGFFELTIADIIKLTPDSTKIVFNIPSDLKSEFDFIPGQYVDVAADLKNEFVRRSYSICSGPDEPLAIGVKQIENGLMSVFLNNEVHVGTSILVSKPQGSFTLSNEAKNVVAIAAGSGITPLLSIAKAFKQEGTFRLFFGNRTENDIMFKEEIDALKNINTNYFLSRAEKEGFEHGRLDKDRFSKIVQSDLSLLKSDAFLLCGPADMILEIRDLLKVYGVNESKIRFELFTPPTEKATNEASESVDFKGSSQVTVRIDGIDEVIEVKAGKFILDQGLDEGIDLPFSCKGGVCSTCKAKVLEGKVEMKMNYSLTDKEIAEGYVLSCQAMPASDKITISYDN